MTNEPNPDLSELFEERSLWEVYRKGPSILCNGFNCAILFTTGALLGVYMFLHYFSILGAALKLDFADLFANWASVGIAFTGTILGFLLAGFAVLFTVLQPQTLVGLHRITRPGQKLSDLKLLLFVFVDVFVHYIAFLFWCTVVLVFGAAKGPADWAGQLLGAWWPGLPSAISHVIFAGWGTWFVVLVLKLKSFVYNLYQTLLLGAADSVE